MERLYEALLNYQDSNAYPFHMPGHKRQKKEFVKGFGNPFQIDITEIDGFDNLHHAEGILKEAQERAAALYHSEETHFLVNGSTCGILSAISACTKKGGKILMARNCHKAAYHGALLQELEVCYLYPEEEQSFGINGGILPKQVEELLEREENVQAVILTSPSYDGVVSDVKAIGDIVHKKGIPLIVDEAHGAHFGFHPYFPKNSVELGADLVIHSLHKTLPSLTQTALLHVNGDLVDREKLAMYLGIYQTSSPSYVFMAGMDECIWLLKEKSGELFTDLKENLQEFYGKVEKLSHIHVADKSLVGHSGIYDFDVSKLVLKVEENGGIYDGNWLAEKLRRDFEIELEMAGVRYGLALSSCMDSREGFVRLADALRQIDKEIGQEKENKKENRIGKDRVTRNEVCCKINEALDRPGKTVPLLEAEGEVSREFAYLYPPGIPLLVPGEIISLGVIEKMKELMGRGYSLQGMKDYSGTFIQVAE